MQLTSPTLEYVDQIVKMLKNNKNPAKNSIRGEKIKYGGEELQKQIYELILEE